MNQQLRSTSPHSWVDVDSTQDEILAIVSFLQEQNTFDFPILSNGLFSAIGSSDALDHISGYGNVWLRDNIHIAWAHLTVLEDASITTRCVQSLSQFYYRYRHRFSDVIAGRADFSEPMNRPHIRFNGAALTELDEKWAHAQNDALGYLLWLTGLLIERQIWTPDSEQWNLVADLVHYLDRIQYWHDEDSGHWEEVRKVAASSVGVVVAGLTVLSRLLKRPEIAGTLQLTDRKVSDALVTQLIQKGQFALQQILPAECVQPDPQCNRQFDAALLFLIYPLNIVDQQMADQIIDRITTQLQGPIGIRRYPGDSYWCADYKQLLGAEQRTADFSDNLQARDALLKPGYEAQWCIFDPILSCIYGERFRTHGLAEDRQRQTEYLRRSLSQLTSADSAFGPWRCPESYYFEQGRWIPNDITPLLWTQANLWQALHLFQVTSPASADNT